MHADAAKMEQISAISLSSACIQPFKKLPQRMLGCTPRRSTNSSWSAA